MIVSIHSVCCIFFPVQCLFALRAQKGIGRVEGVVGDRLGTGRGGGWRMCILALCRACRVCVCVCVCSRVLYVRAPLSS